MAVRTDADLLVDSRAAVLWWLTIKKDATVRFDTGVPMGGRCPARLQFDISTVIRAWTH
jgi:hypothetical protein